MQPKKYTNPRIALLNIELELKSEKENAEIRVDSVEVSAFICCEFYEVQLNVISSNKAYCYPVSCRWMRLFQYFFQFSKCLSILTDSTFMGYKYYKLLYVNC